ncbi:MAG: hypothetical protein AB7S26_18370 [Sandaracinaceae bacterium]
MSRALSVAALALSGCYASHGLSSEVDAGADRDVDRVVDDGGLAHCPGAETASALWVGPTRECVLRRTLGAPRSCRSFAGRHEGAETIIARRSEGRVDIRVACVDAPCEVYAISPDACDGCDAVAPDDEGIASPRFAAYQVDGTIELIVAGLADVEVCFDPDYGPGP